jgi:hypothetical protein
MFFWWISNLFLRIFEDSHLCPVKGYTFVHVKKNWPHVSLSRRHKKCNRMSATWEIEVLFRAISSILYLHRLFGAFGYIQNLVTQKQDMQYTYNVILRRVCANCCSGKAGSFTCSESVFVALGRQHINACAILSSLFFPIYHTFPHYLIKAPFFKKNYWTQYMCFDFLYNFCLKQLSF